ncbi:MAG TPA: PHP domain-containing protein [Longimicrobiales bacterium]|nr:PHP domain-containing protein [Longimicrobiales bacterium]
MARDPSQGANLNIDMHLHTGASFDCTSDPDAVVRTAFHRGMDRVCITDHNEVDAAFWLRRRYGERVIPGEEVKTRERVDIIGLYLKELIPAGTPARETCERIRDQGGVVYVPHPFAGGKGTGGEVLEAIADLVHVIEGFNGRIHQPQRNRLAVEWAAARGLPTGAGSDAHTLGEVGRVFARIPHFADGPDGLRAALVHSTLHGHASSRFVHLASTWAKVRKRLPGGGWKPESQVAASAAGQGGAA